MSVYEATATLSPKPAVILELAADDGVHAFDLSETGRVSLGRHHSNDLQLRSRRASTYHAEILSEVEGLVLRDMGSTNGTYVNDELVTRKKLRSGDIIRIGGLTLKVSLAPRPETSATARSEKFAVGTSGRILPSRGQAAAPEREGSEANDATLPDLLTELSRREASAAIRVRSEGREGKIVLRDGAVVHCEFGAARREKAMYRLLALDSGAYEIEQAPPPDTAPRSIHEPTDVLVVEGLQQVEALDKLSRKLPSVATELTLDETCGVAVNTLTGDEIAIYQQLIRWKTLARVLDESEMTDFMVLLLAHALLQKGFLRTSPPQATALEATVIQAPQPA
jgi:pSer/pThr/pTyr-binding forkhead associated (FHA) protein